MDCKTTKDINMDTFVRKSSNKCNPIIKKIIGSYYWILHIFIMLSCGIILLFDNNIYNLVILLNIACLDCIACIFLHDCPLTILEKKYLKTSIVKKKTNLFKNANIFYKCDHRYEKTLEFLTNIVSFIVGKISFLLILKLLNITLNTSQ